MIRLIFRNVTSRPLRSALTFAGIAIATAVLVCLLAFGEGYRHGLQRELDRSGVQMMLVPLGCPYDAAARVLKNNTLETALPEAALVAARQDPAVAAAAPLLMAAVPHWNDKRTDMWVGIDETALSLKPWWTVKSGNRWFGPSNEVVLGADAAAVEMRAPGDKLFSPEANREFRVAGVLNRSGTSDDSVFFVRLATAQQMFGRTGTLTAIAIRLKDPALAREATARLQRIPGAQVVTVTEMMGTFLNLIGAVRTLVVALAAIAIVVSALTVFNTLLSAVIERTRELAVLRAIGASRVQIFVLLIGEALLLTLLGALGGIAIAFAAGPWIEATAKGWLPLAPSGVLLSISSVAMIRCALLALSVGAVAALYPAWRASRLQPAIATRPE